jgi:hypothetical protein
MKYRYLIAALFFVVPGITFLRADIYQWTDPRGVVHYGNQPPADARNVVLKFKDPAPAAGAGGAESGQPAEPADTETLLQEFEQELQREQDERRRQAEEIRRSQPPTAAEVVARERERLEKKIAELENRPLEDFGSQRNKRNLIGYYQYRLQTLIASPDDYFNKPDSFEGNVQPSK